MKSKILFSVLFFFLIHFHISAENGFIPNQGQVIDETGKTRPDVLFTYELPGAKMFFHENKITFVFWNIEYMENEKSLELRNKGDLEGAKFHSMRIHQMHIELEFLGSNSGPLLTFDNKQSSYVNYYLGHCPEGIQNVAVYKKVTYSNIYNNIDLIFMATENGLKYDLVLKPGAKLSDIRFSYNGISKLEMKDGSMHVENEFRPIIENIPHSYYQENKTPVQVQFNILSDNTYGFACNELSSDSIEQTIIIDPTLSWSTYFERTVTGGVSTIRGNNTTDADGNFFYQINTYTADLPIANPGAPVYLDPSYNPTSGLDIYFAKFNINRELIWSTYLGGTSGNQSNYYDHALATWNGYLYICGNTNSNNFPLVNQGSGAYYQTYPGSTCGFLSKFNATTGQMIHSTYLRSYDYHSMAVDNSGNIAVMSFNYTWSVSPNVMSRTGAYNQATHGGDSDLFLYMFNSSLQQTWGTYFGGAGYTDPHGITFDSNGNLFLFSRSSSNTGMPLLNPGGGAFFQSTVTDKYDCGISKFNTSGALVWSTYFGGAGLEGLSYSKALVNDNDDIILTTTTRSTVMPVFSQGGGAYYQGTPPVGLNDGWGGDPGCGFYIRFNNSGVRQHATYIGVDNESNYIHDQAQGNCGRQYMILSTIAFPVTVLSGAYNQTNAIPSSYGYMALEFNSAFAIRWATYLQRDSSYFEQFAIDKQNGRLYVTGSTQATDYITANPGGGASFDGVKNMASPTQYTLAIMEFDIGAPPTVWVSGGGNPEVCSGGSITLNASGSGTIYWYDQQTGGTQLGTGTSYTLNNVTSTTTIWVESNDGGCESARTPITITVLTAPSVTLSASANPICQGTSVTLTAGGASSYSWSGGLGTGTTKNVTPGSTTTYTITGTGSNTCTATASVTVTVNPNPTVTLTPSSSNICNGSSTTLTAGGASSYSWSGGLGTGNPKVVNPSSNTTYTVTGTAANGCSASASTTINVNANPSVTLTPSATTVCSGSPVTLTGGGASSYSWSGGLGTGNPKIVNPTSNTTYTVTGTDGNGCSASASTTINVNSNPSVGISASSTTICNGQSSTLTGTGASNYSWSSGLGTGNPKIVTPSSNTTYTVTGTDANNCSATANITINVNANPSVSITPSASAICNGQSTTLTAGGASSYSWSSGLGTGNPKIVNPTSNTTYTVTGTDANGCSASASVFITVHSNPTISLNASSTGICEGESVTLTAGGGSSYVWSPSGSGSSFVATPSSNTTWSVTGTDGNGCSNTTQVTINVSASYDASIDPVTSMCLSAAPFNLNAADPGGVWSGPGITNSSTGLFNPSIAGAGTHTITYGIAGTCGDTGTVQITVFALPAVSLNASSTSICEGEQVTLTAGGAANYTWSPSGSGNSVIETPSSTTTWYITGTDSNNCSNTAQITVNVSSAFDATINPVGTVCSNDPAFNLTAANGGGVWSGAGITNTSTGLFNPTFAGAGNHEIIYTIYGSCGDADTITVTVLQAPTVTLNADNSSICAGEQVSLTAGGADTYVWFPSGSGSFNTFTLNSTTTYTVTGTTGSCSNTASVTVTVHNLPNVTLIAGDDEICDGETTSLTAGGANTYLWSNSGSGNPINVSPSTTTIYTVTGTDGNTCSASTSVTITVYDSPYVSLSASQTTICEGDSVVITAGGADSYVWHPSGSGSANTYYPSSSTTYSVTGTNSYNCSSTASVTVTVTPPADATIVSTGPFCSADDPVVLMSVTSGGTWSGIGITNPSSGTFDPSVAGSGTHTITYSIPGNCGDTDVIDILVFESPEILISATPISCDGASDGILELHVGDGLPPYIISWNNGSNDTLLSGLSSGNYSVVVTDDNLCSVTSGFSLDDPGIPCDTYIPHVVVPNVFSPNGDGQNDVLYVRGEGISRLDFVIYTRWGEKVFETTNKDIGWDGTYKGEMMDPAVFVFSLKATLSNYETISLSGDITLAR